MDLGKPLLEFAWRNHTPNMFHALRRRTDKEHEVEFHFTSQIEFHDVFENLAASQINVMIFQARVGGFYYNPYPAYYAKITSTHPNKLFNRIIL